MKDHSQEQLMRLKHLAAERIRRTHDKNWADERRRQINEARYRRREGLEPTRKNHHVDDRRTIERNPEYDPNRDGEPMYASPFAQALGEPPIGRRALDKVRA